MTSDDLEKVEMIMLDFIKDYNPEQEKEYKAIKEKHYNSKMTKNILSLNLNDTKDNILQLPMKREKKKFGLIVFVAVGTKLGRRFNFCF